MAQEDKGPVIVALICEAREGTETLEINRAEWDSMTPAERLALVEAAAVEHVDNQGGWGWSIDDPGDQASVATSRPDPLRDLAESLASRYGVPMSAKVAREALDAAIVSAREALGKTKEG